MDLREHFLVIWRRKWWVLLASMVIAVLVYAVFDLQQPTYQATAELQVVPGQVASSSTQSQDTLFLAGTYAQLAMTHPVVGQAAQQSHLNIDERTAGGRLAVSASADVGFITVTAKGPTASDATALCASEVTALSATVATQQQAALQGQLASVQSTISSLSSQLTNAAAGSAEASALQTELQALYQAVATRESQSTNQLSVVAPAQAGTSPIAPTPKRDALLALVTALVIDSELAVGFELLSDRFRGEDVEEEIRRVTGLPVLAEIPDGSADEVIEAFRTLRTSLLFLESSTSLRTAALVSSEPAAGKSFACINLAVSLAELGVRVALVDADMRRPVLHARLSLPQTPGLSEVLSGGDLWSALHRTRDMDNLVVLSAGSPVPDPPGLMSATLTARLLAPLLQDPTSGSELIVFDTPAQALFPDAVTVAAHCDVTILVVDLRHSRRRGVRRTLDRLRRVNARPVGVLVNRAPAAGGSGRYRYRYRYAQTVARPNAAPTPPAGGPDGPGGPAGPDPRVPPAAADDLPAPAQRWSAGQVD